MNCDKIEAMELQIGMAKTAKSGAEDSAETADVVERPSGGGYSVIVCDGLIAGKNSKSISFFVANKISALISEGVRDSTAIRATSDQLFTIYGGSAQSLMNIVSVDLNTDTVVVSRNNPNPVYYYSHGQFTEWSNDSRAIGTSKHIQPSITEIPIQCGSILVIASDGVFSAGAQYGHEIDIPMLILAMVDDQNTTNSQAIADFIMSQAIQLDQGSPQNDMSIMVMRIVDNKNSNLRRFTYSLPIDRSACL